ncbi:TMhelix containing protein [Vibrio phage 1.023.O._10N.222.51.B4]|nr:TMhelix containing protein [Vibrio phage 1.023.O._10N.222.51.B4]
MLGKARNVLKTVWKCVDKTVWLASTSAFVGLFLGFGLVMGVDLYLAFKGA